MKSFIKALLKDWFLILKVREKFSPVVQISQRKMYHYYRNLAQKKKLPPLSEAGYKVFSQFEEDGLLLFIFSAIGMTHKTFVEIGSDDGVNSNSANLYFNFGWHGLFIDGNSKSINRGKKFYAKNPHIWHYQPTFLCSKVNAENINELISRTQYQGTTGLLSIDIDGYDYWVWKAITAIDPQVVIIETHNEFGMEDIVVPYDPNYSFPGKHPLYHGASPVAMTKLAKEKGYRLVGANQLGFNFIFVKNGLVDEEIPEVTVESVLQHPSVAEGHKAFEAIKNFEYIKG
jgi:hypothetical protein